MNKDNMNKDNMDKDNMDKDNMDKEKEEKEYKKEEYENGNENGKKQTTDKSIWSVYLIKSQNNKNTYIGASNNVCRRLRCHNGELVGGAKRTQRNRPWSHVCIVSGFDKINALKYEWRIKRKKSKKTGKLRPTSGLKNRIFNMYEVLHEARWKDLNLTFEWHDNYCKEKFTPTMSLPLNITTNNEKI